MSCTLPQVFMLNYAAYREAENAKRKADYKRDREEGIVDERDPYLPEYGMKLSELKHDPVKFGIYLKNGVSESVVLTSTKLVQHLQDRAQRIAGRNPAARIVVPEDMKWVLVQEHGSIGPYPITPKNADSLRLPPKEDFPLYHGSVEHPGVSPKKFITAIEQDIQELAGKSSARVLVESQFDPDAVQEALVDQIMPEIKEMIAKSMSDVLHQNRTSDFPGKLGTTTPADAFREKAEIEES